MSDVVRVVNVNKSWGATRVLNDVSATILVGEVTGIVGRSGAGKSTLLRILAGLDRAYDGDVELPAEWSRRAGAIGMVFQGLSLWPHLTTRQHIELVLENSSTTDRRGTTESILEEVQLDEATWKRRPSELSGGEAQRLAVARALAMQPDLLLLDEPFAQVDFPLRQSLMENVARVVARRRVTVVIVTHSWLELLSMCRNVVVLDEGRVQQQGTLDEVYRTPQSPQVAELVGPIVKIDEAYFKRDLIQGDPDCHLAEAEGRRWFRPQQIELIEDVASSWLVERCDLGPFGYNVRLAQGDKTLAIASSSRAAVGMRVAIRTRAMS